MRYTKELHERVRQNLRMFDYPRFDDGDIEALLDEIDRLNAYALRLLSDETRTWHCEKCGHNWLSNSLVGKTYAVCPECESPMRPMSEIRQEEIDRLTAEVEKHRWIPVEDMSKLDDGKCYQVLTKENPLFPDCEFYSFNDGWATDKEVTHYREIDLPEPPKEEE